MIGAQVAHAPRTLPIVSDSLAETMIKAVFGVSLAQPTPPQSIRKSEE
jgi:hypothetical protein